MNERTIFGFLITILLILGIGSTVEAATIYVTAVQDNVNGSLREAVTTANANNEDDTIYLPGGIYYLNGDPGDDANLSGDLDINTTGSITIIGDGAATTIIDGGGTGRVLHILAGTVTISGVAIQNGGFISPTFNCDTNTRADLAVEHGGGINNNGILTLKKCIVNDNSSKKGCYLCVDGTWEYTTGGHGGGIYNTGTLTLSGTTVKSNTASTGSTDLYTAASPGNGGGIYNAGTLNAVDSTVTDNKTADGPNSRINYPSGHGGGVYNTGTMTLTRTIVNKNVTGNGWNGIMSSGGNDGGYGGGIYNHQGNATLSYCAINGNKTGDGGSAEESPGDGGPGGGIYNTGTLVLNNSALTRNTTGKGESAIFGSSGGNGAGLMNAAGQATLTNCTVSDNYAGSAGGHDSVEEKGAGGNGAGIYNATQLLLKSCTVCYNLAGRGEDVSFYGRGGGIYNTDSGTAQLENTIVSDNYVFVGAEYPDFWGTLDSLGYNLVKDTSGCTFTGNLTGNITGVDPLLGPLQNNGGPTEIVDLIVGSPAIDAGSASGLTTDQRGYARTVDIEGIANAGDGTDIGAFEYNAAPTPEISLDHTTLNFSVDTAGTGKTTSPLFISNGGGGTLEWSASTDADWFYTNPLSGTGAGEIFVSVDTQNLSAGTYTGTISFEAAGALNSPYGVTVRLTVYPAGSTLPPFGLFETPMDGSTVSGSIPVTGWALDDIGIQAVKIYRAEGDALVYIGDAMLVEGARPDVEKTYPTYPQAHKAGWGYMLLTNFLTNGGNGTFTLHAGAVDIEGNEVSLGTKTIIVDNANAVKPFGAIDTPAQGGSASGSEYVNWGWALTPMPNTIPTGGSTILVAVDGVGTGNMTYNIYRDDIASLFPGYNNSNGAVGYNTFDTTQYENGIHTISWIVEDDAGNADGIGSRYFTIQNSTQPRRGTLLETHNSQQVFNSFPRNPQPATRNSFSFPSSLVSPNPVGVVKGYGKNTETLYAYPGKDGKITVEIRELERLVLHLAPNTLNLTPTSLPIGSTLDAEKGIFYWQPGAGFYGKYEFTFMEQTGAGDWYKRYITVRINPRFLK